MADSKLDLLQGTLDLMVLRTLEAMGPLHGYGIARRIEQVSDRFSLTKAPFMLRSSASSSAAGPPPSGAPQTTIAKLSFIASPTRAASSSPKIPRTGKGSRW